MDKIVLETITDEDIELIKQWLQKDYIKKWYDPVTDWINELKNRNGEYSFIKHFIVKNNFEKIGFCQYYDCFVAKELWYQVNKQNYTFSIDYLIGDENYLDKGYGKKIIRQLINKIKIEGGKEIIVQPDEENILSNKVLLANGFTYKQNEKYFYKKLEDTMEYIEKTQQDNEAVLEIIKGWGSDIIVTKGKIYKAEDLDGILAYENGKIIGLGKYGGYSKLFFAENNLLILRIFAENNLLILRKSCIFAF